MIYYLDLGNHSPTYVSNHHIEHSRYIRLYLSIKLRGKKDRLGVFMVLAPHHSQVFKSSIQVVKYS